MLVCLCDRNGHKLFGHRWLGLASPLRFQALNCRGLEAAGCPQGQNKTDPADQLHLFPPPENPSLSVPQEAVAGEAQYCHCPRQTRAGGAPGIFSKVLVRYFRKATQEQLPHVDVLCRTLVITVDVLLPLRLLQNSITRKLEPEMSGHCKYKHCGRTPSCPQQEQGVCFYPELDIAGREDLDSVHVLGAGNSCLRDRTALSPRH